MPKLDLDLANEHDVRDARHVQDEELKQLRNDVRSLDPSRLVTSPFGGHDLNLEELRSAVLGLGFDFIAVHRPRTPETAAKPRLKLGVVPQCTGVKRESRAHPLPGAVSPRL